jgi:hypothetical protein
MTDRAHGVAVCAVCGYEARLTADDAAEVSETLRRILLAHLLDCHPEERIANNVRELLLRANFGVYG